MALGRACVGAGELEAAEAEEDRALRCAPLPCGESLGGRVEDEDDDASDDDALRDGGRVGRAVLFPDTFDPADPGGWPLSRNGCRRFGDGLPFAELMLALRILLTAPSSPEEATRLLGDELLDGEDDALVLPGDFRIVLPLRIGVDGALEAAPPMPPMLLL